MGEQTCTCCENVADFGGNYVECVKLHRFIDWYYWNYKSPDDCPKKKGEAMKTITYTYDEEHPTNRDYLVAALADAVDDGGASYESVVEYNIDCPYRSNSDCLNEYEGNEYDTIKYREGCVRCKLAWLDREYDTYPSDDGVWERRTDGEKAGN